MTFLILSSIPIQSGTGIRVSSIARALSENGYTVILTGIGPKPAGLEKVRYSKIPSLNNRGLAFLLSFIINSMVALFNKADVVMASKTLPNSVFPVLFNFSKKKITLLDLDDLEYGYWAGTWLAPVLSFMDRLSVKLFDRIAVHTEELKDYAVNVLKVPADKTVFLKQGVRAALFTGTGEKIKKKFGLDGKKIILYTAHLGVASKGGLDFIFRGCREIFQGSNDVRLLIAGSGDQKGQFELLAEKMGIRDRVIFVGAVSHEAMPDYFSAADVSVNYLEDSDANRCRSSIKVRESLAAGVPVVCNLVGSDLLQFRDYLHVFKTGSIEDFVSRLKQVIAGDGKDRTEEGKKIVEEKWDWGIVMKDFLKELKH